MINSYIPLCIICVFILMNNISSLWVRLQISIITSGNHSPPQIHLTFLTLCSPTQHAMALLNRGVWNLPTLIQRTNSRWEMTFKCWKNLNQIQESVCLWPCLEFYVPRRIFHASSPRNKRKKILFSLSFFFLLILFSFWGSNFVS